MSAAGSFSDRLIDAIERAGACACVGLDPVAARLPEPLRGAHEVAAVESFCMGVLDAVAGAVGVVKPQSACFERYGGAGFSALERVCAAARDRGLLVILDAKRGDIGVSAEHYAAMAFGAMGADAVTVSAYMGADTLAPYLDERWAGRGVFALVRTSNAGSDATQAAKLEGGATVAEHVGAMLAGLGESRTGSKGWSDVGAVVGATKPNEAAAMRAAMPRQPLLVPGYGAQGGTIDDIRPLLVQGKGAFRGVVVNASRSVLYPEGGAGADWKQKVRDAAERFAEEMRSLAV